MKSLISFLIIGISINALGQQVNLSAPNLLPNQVYMSSEKLDGKKVIKVIKDSTLEAVDEATFVKIKDADFKDGIID